MASADLNGNGVDDQLKAFAFGWDEDRHSRYYGQMVTAFVSTPAATFDATNVLPIPDSELMIYSDFEVDIRGRVVAIKGKQRMPANAQCCPTARAEIVFGLVDGRLRAIEGHWQYDPLHPE